MNKLSQNLDLRQSQNLVMTPQLQQAIQILQMNNVELNDFIEEAIEQNPLLEKGERDDDRGSDESEGNTDSETRDDMQDAFEGSWDESAPQNTKEHHDFDAGAAQIGAGGSRNFDIMDESFENRMSRETTLREHLEEQLHLAFSDPRDRMIGASLIDMLDEGGYLREATDALAERLGCKIERVEKLLSKMKQFEPSGIFAADLKECLAIQLAELDLLDAPMKKLLDNMDLIAKHDMKKLASVCDVNQTYLSDMLADIRRLNPKPASLYDHMVVQTAIPDVLMKKLPANLGGGWRVELNSETLPKVLVNNEYYTQVAGAARDKKDKKYLDEQLQSASWLVKAMDQRAKTILKVAGAIIEEQEAFFLYGVEFLRPLTLKDIAKEVEMHESTISRVTNNKYIGTPRGLFELKYFFSTALGEGAGAHAAEAVKARIKNLIDAETIDAVLSDEALADMLKEEGIDIARRTVAKYRESMNIGSSAQRRRQKKMESSNS